MDNQEVYSLELLPDVVLLYIIERLSNRSVYMLSIAMPRLYDRLPRMQWIEYEYRYEHPYACPLCIYRFEYMTLYNFHMALTHRARTRNEILEEIDDFFTLKPSRHVRK